jgi:hypothetical protein
MYYVCWPDVDLKVRNMSLYSTTQNLVVPTVYYVNTSQWLYVKNYSIRSRDMNLVTALSCLSR